VSRPKPPSARSLNSALVLCAVALLVVFALVARPIIIPGQVQGPRPDSLDYAYGAASLLRGRYVADWDGVPHTPRYPPGFSILLTPAVALAGVEGAVWVPYIAGVLLGALAALLGARLGGTLAAPLAVGTVLCAVAPFAFSHMVMSDLPSVMLAMLEVAVLALGGRPATSLVAGLLAGALIWIRPATAVLLSAGMAGISARGERWRRAALYLTGALPPVVLLGVWQFAMFGSPLTTSYQAAGASPSRSGALGSFFSLHYVLQPYQRDPHPLGWQLPNVLLYPLELLGADFFVSLPGVGLLGLVAALRFGRKAGALGVVGRFGLAAVAATLLVYVPYFWQSARFMMVPAAIVNLAAAVHLAGWLAKVSPRLGLARAWR
jgi:hypothetical protein